MTKTVLLTGGFGNLGGRIASRLNDQSEYQLRLGTRSERKVPKWASNAEIATFDVTETSSFNDSFADVDTVIHLVGVSDVESAMHPDLAEFVTVQGTRNVLQASISAGIKRFIYFSTAHVYGSPLVGTLDETTSPKPQHPYATTHIAAERLVLAAHELGQIEGITFRCANSFGRPMEYEMGDWKTVVGDLCRQLVFNNTLTLQSNGLQERNFIARYDVCSAVKHFLQLDSHQLGNGIFNLGSTRSSSVMTMALTIQERGIELFGRLVEITTPIESGVRDLPQPLNFSINRLTESGFVPLDDFSLEIDGLLTMLDQQRGTNSD